MVRSISYFRAENLPPKLPVTCSENRIARIVAEDDINASAKAAFRPKTTIPDSSAAPSPNLTKDLAPKNPQTGTRRSPKEILLIGEQKSMKNADFTKVLNC